MKPTMLCWAGVAIVAALAVPAANAAPQSETAKSKASKRAAFLRADAATRISPVQQPRTEREALAGKREVMPGVIEMHLPEDRMVELVLVRHPDGSTQLVHQPVGGAPAPRKQEAARE